METATEVLTKVHPKPINGELQYAWVIQAMKMYANEKLDEASKRVRNGATFQEINSLKDKL